MQSYGNNNNNIDELIETLNLLELGGEVGGNRELWKTYSKFAQLFVQLMEKNSRETWMAALLELTRRNNSYIVLIHVVVAMIHNIRIDNMQIDDSCRKSSLYQCTQTVLASLSTHRAQKLFRIQYIPFIRELLNFAPLKLDFNPLDYPLLCDLVIHALGFSGIAFAEVLSTGGLNDPKKMAILVEAFLCFQDEGYAILAEVLTHLAAKRSSAIEKLFQAFNCLPRTRIAGAAGVDYVRLINTIMHHAFKPKSHLAIAEVLKWVINRNDPDVLQEIFKIIDSENSGQFSRALERLFYVYPECAQSFLEKIIACDGGYRRLVMIAAPLIRNHHTNLQAAAILTHISETKKLSYTMLTMQCVAMVNNPLDPNGGYGACTTFAAMLVWLMECSSLAKLQATINAIINQDSSKFVMYVLAAMCLDRREYVDGFIKALFDAANKRGQDYRLVTDALFGLMHPNLLGHARTVFAQLTKQTEPARRSMFLALLRQMYLSPSSESEFGKLLKLLSELENSDGYVVLTDLIEQLPNDQIKPFLGRLINQKDCSTLVFVLTYINSQNPRRMLPVFARLFELETFNETKLALGLLKAVRLRSDLAENIYAAFANIMEWFARYDQSKYIDSMIKRIISLKDGDTLTGLMRRLVVSERSELARMVLNSFEGAGENDALLTNILTQPDDQGRNLFMSALLHQQFDLALDMALVLGRMPDDLLAAAANQRDINNENALFLLDRNKHNDICRQITSVVVNGNAAHDDELRADSI